MNLKRILIGALALLCGLTVVACGRTPIDSPPPAITPGGQEEPAPPEQPTPQEESGSGGLSWECDPAGFPGPPPAKPPVPTAGLSFPGGLESFPINLDRALGYAFRGGHMPLIAAPAGARCIVWYNGNELGLAAGLVWVVDDASNVSSTLLVVRPGTPEGFLVFNQSDEPVPVPFAVTPLKQQTDVPVPIDVTLRSYSACFQLEVEAGQWFSHCTEDPQYNVSSRFEEAFNGQVIAETEKSLQMLMERALVPPDASMLWSFSISEVEDPVDVENCRPEELGSCPADIVITPAEYRPAALQGQINGDSRVGKPGQRLQNGDFMGIMSLSQVLDLSEMEPAVILEPGDYAFYALSQEEIEVVGVLWESGEVVGPFLVPATLAPLVDESGPEAAAEVDSCRLFSICLFRECR